MNWNKNELNSIFKLNTMTSKIFGMRMNKRLFNRFTMNIWKEGRIGNDILNDFRFNSLTSLQLKLICLIGILSKEDGNELNTKRCWGIGIEKNENWRKGRLQVLKPRLKIQRNDFKRILTHWRFHESRKRSMKSLKSNVLNSKLNWRSSKKSKKNRNELKKNSRNKKRRNSSSMLRRSNK